MALSLNKPNGRPKFQADEKFKELHAEKKAKRDQVFARDKASNTIEKWVLSIYTLKQAAKFMETQPNTLSKKLKNPEKLTVDEIRKISLLIMIDPHLVFTSAIGMKSEHYDVEEIKKTSLCLTRVWNEQRRYLNEKKNAADRVEIDDVDEDDFTEDNWMENPFL